MSITHVRTTTEMEALRRKLGARRDWHEPDEQCIDATVTGHHFDNALGADELVGQAYEMQVNLYQHGELIAVVNLADLCALACVGAKCAGHQS